MMCFFIQRIPIFQSHKFSRSARIINCGACIQPKDYNPGIHALVLVRRWSQVMRYDNTMMTLVDLHLIFITTFKCYAYWLGKPRKSVQREVAFPFSVFQRTSSFMFTITFVFHHRFKKNHDNEYKSIYCYSVKPPSIIVACMNVELIHTYLHVIVVVCAMFFILKMVISIF